MVFWGFLAVTGLTGVLHRPYRCGAGGVAICVASATAVASAPSSFVGHGWSSRRRCLHARVAVRDDLPIATGAVATMRGSTGSCPSTVATDVRTATCGFVVLLAVPDGVHLSDPVVHSHEVGVLRELGDDLSRAHSLSLTCYRSDRHEALLWGGVHPALDLVECFREVPDGRDSRRRRRSSFHFLLRSRRASLLASVSSAGALADNSSTKISLRYWSGTVPEGHGVSLVVTKTCRSGEPRLESPVATSVGVCSPAGASGVPSWKGSESS
jgi:hypothetical protein